MTHSITPMFFSVIYLPPSCYPSMLSGCQDLSQSVRADDGPPKASWSALGFLPLPNPCSWLNMYGVELIYLGSVRGGAAQNAFL